MKWRLIWQEAQDPFFNMALDEALFLNYRIPTLRFYTWSEPAISIGYFQSLKKFNLENLNIKYVRRITGGRAVFHSQDITYSLICPSGALSILSFYKLISRAFIKGLKSMGIQAELTSRFNNQNNFCFASSFGEEVAVKGKKILGSAQVRKENLLLQQGSLILDLNNNLVNLDFKGSLTSLKEELKREVKIKEVVLAVIEGFKEIFKVKFFKTSPTLEEINLAEKLKEKKYQTREWNFLR